MNSPGENPITPVIPDHQLLRQIGEGGYGQVWLARNIIGTYRAVKIVFRSKFCEAAPYDREFKGIKKFEPISRTHPGLVDLLQIGRNDPDGYFYYVMELADDEMPGDELHPESYSAKTLGKELDARGRLPVEEVLRLGIDLAEALGHMHLNGLVHRDIKPSNIIFVGGAPKLADIGLVVAVTDARTFVGTEGFIPPEGPGTAQADLYSLGKVLYEIGTGQDRQSYPELPQDLAAFPDCDQLMELNEIIVKACANSPLDRYKQAEELRGDLEMLLGGRSVKRLRFVERQLSRVRRVAVVATIIAIAAVSFGYAVMRIRQRERGLLAAAYVASGARLMEDGNLHGSLPYFAEALRLEEKNTAAAGTHRLRIGSVLQQSPKLLQFWQLTNAVKDLHFSPDGTRLLMAGRKMICLVDLQSGAIAAEMPVPNDLETAVFSPDGRQIVIADGDFVTLTEAGLGTNFWRVKLPGHILSAEFSPDGETIIAACSDQCVHFLETQTGELLDGPVYGHSKELCYASFSPDGTLFLTGGRDGTVRLWDVRTRSLLHSNLLRSHWIHDASFSPDGRKYVTASTDHTVRVWDVATGRESAGRMEHRGEVRRARFSPDGGKIVSIGYDNTVRFWDVRTGRPLAATLNLHGLGMAAVFSPEGRRVATADYSGAVKIWDLAPTAPLSVGPAVISPDGQRYITYGTNSFRVWNALDDAPLTPWVPSAGTIESVLASTNAGTIVLLGKNRTDLQPLVEIHQPGGGSPRSISLPKAKSHWLSLDGRWLLASRGNDASLWETASGRRVFEHRDFTDPVRPAFSPDGRSVLLASGKNLFSFDLQSGAETFPPWRHTMNLKGVDFSRDGSQFVIALDGSEFSPGGAQIGDAKTGRQLSPVLPHGEGVRKACFSHDGRWVATADPRRGAGVWDVKTSQLRFAPVPLLWPVRTVDWSPDDRWLLAGSWFEGQVLDASTGRPVTPAFLSADTLLGGGFFAGGRRIWARTAQTVLMWNLPPATGTPAQLTALARHLGVVIPPEARWEDTPAAVAELRRRCVAGRQQFRAGLGGWHRQQAATAERQTDWFAAQFHLDQLLKESPDDEALRDRRETAAQEWAKSGGPNLNPGAPVPLERLP